MRLDAAPVRRNLRAPHVGCTRAIRECLPAAPTSPHVCVPAPKPQRKQPLRPAPIPLWRQHPSVRSSLVCARRMQLPHPVPIAHPSFVWMPCRLRERRCSRRWEEERCNSRSTFEISKYNSCNICLKVVETLEKKHLKNT